MTLIKQFSGVIIHLNPLAIFFSEDLRNAKVIPGDSEVFSKQSFEDEKYRFHSPEAILGQEMEESQIWWDLGIILYELASGNFTPFYHSNLQVKKRLIEKYQVVFPQNLPYTISDELKNLIRELLTKNKNNRLGYVDQGGVEDIMENMFLRID